MRSAAKGDRPTPAGGSWLPGLLAGVVVAAAAHAAGGVTIKSRVVVETDAIAFRDLVEGSVPDELGDLRLGSAPPWGRERFFSCAFLSSRARPYLAEEKLVCEKGVTVARASRLLLPEELERAVVAETARRYDLGKGEVRLRTRAPSVQVPPGKVAYEVEASRSGCHVRGLLQVLRDAEVVARWRFLAELRPALTAYKLLQDVNVGQPILSSALEPVEADACARGGGTPFSGEVETGWVAARFLRAGSLLRWGDVRVPYAVRRHDLVEAVYEAGGLQIRFPVQALQDGGVGEEVQVMSLATRRVLAAEVAAEGTVVIKGGEI